MFALLGHKNVRIDCSNYSYTFLSIVESPVQFLKATSTVSQGFVFNLNKSFYITEYILLIHRQKKLCMAGISNLL